MRSGSSFNSIAVLNEEGSYNQLSGTIVVKMEEEAVVIERSDNTKDDERTPQDDRMTTSDDEVAQIEKSDDKVEFKLC